MPIRRMQISQRIRTMILSPSLVLLLQALNIGTEHSVVFVDGSYAILQSKKQQRAMLLAARAQSSLRPLCTGYSLRCVVAQPRHRINKPD